ncbi:hypothetical protein JI666_09235 [Bacillus sp. NTK071]|uniref:hypothetical protein n=1 Tax=Bacillus sp. NTK071 TaxID=2802175 RepID=UPI001A90474A|nr:hypothetical protein [Bacillus sp. NTK071]MBN8208927.1 hypothetical protein [Bacillus sp. NTK071]
MATIAITRKFVLNEEEVTQILATPRKEIRQTNAFNDLNLSKDERVTHAANILKSNKWR